MSSEGHETTRHITTCVSIAIVLCSITWAICLYNIEAVKHPVKIKNDVTVERSIDYERNQN